MHILDSNSSGSRLLAGTASGVVATAYEGGVAVIHWFYEYNKIWG